MVESFENVQQGQIVWADVRDPRGKLKTRPLVVVTATDEILLDGPIVGVAITTTFPDPTPSTMVVLPWQRQRHPATRLAKRSAAVCNWLVELTPSQVREIKGYVPSKTLLEILRRVRQFGAMGDPR